MTVELSYILYFYCPMQALAAAVKVQSIFLAGWHKRRPDQALESLG